MLEPQLKEETKEEISSDHEAKLRSLTSCYPIDRDDLAYEGRLSKPWASASLIVIVTCNILYELTQIDENGFGG